MNEAQIRTISPFSVLPPLTTQEFEALKRSIELEGVREPVVVDENGNVLDGTHRLKIKPDAPQRTISGLTHNEKLAFVFQVNLSRRNLSPAQKKEAHSRMREIAFALRKEDHVKNTQERVAVLLGVSRQLVSYWFGQEKGGSIANFGNTSAFPDARVKVPPKQRPIILSRIEAGESQEQVAADYGVSTRQIRTIANKERKQKEEAESRAQAVTHLQEMNIYHGDFRSIGNSVRDASVDLIFTDPPYADVFIYTDLAQFAERVLRPGGWCLAYCGTAHLPQVLAGMSEHLTYGWVFAVQHAGGDPRFRKYRIQNKWKPIVGFFKPPLSVWWSWFTDLVSGGKEKDYHSWQQALGEAKHYIRSLSPEHGLVCDPFAGSGTTCLAAKELSRQWVAFEQNEDTVKTARLRLGD